MHVGHGRTYIVPDVVARFWRMRGKQVLFPMAFHVTGAPVVGISKRIAKQGREDDPALPRPATACRRTCSTSFTDPLTIVRHFADEYQRVMTSCGLSIDWRRRFITVDPTYSKFIEWQWKHLYEAGHVIKGAHPVPVPARWTRTRSATTISSEGDKAEVIKFMLVMFRFGDAFIPCATPPARDHPRGHQPLGKPGRHLREGNRGREAVDCLEGSGREARSPGPHGRDRW